MLLRAFRGGLELKKQESFKKFKEISFHGMVWCLSSDENRERSSSAPFVGKTGRRSFPTEAGDLQGGA